MLEKILHEVVKIFESDHPFRLMLQDISGWILYLWQYPVFTTADKQQVLIGNILVSLILFFIGLRLAKKLSKAINKKLSKTLEVGVVSSLERLSYYFFIVIMAVFVLDVANVPLTAFTIVGTTLALGVGLGSQNIANNFISGLIIMIERPIKLGDIIEVNGVVGQIINIGARCVSICTDKNINILIPNSNILQNMIINWTLDDTILRTSILFRIAFDCDIKEIDKIILDAVKSHKYILNEPAPRALVKEFCSDHYEFEVEYWVDLNSNTKVRYVIDDINRSLLPFIQDRKIIIVDKHVNFVIEQPSLG